MSEQKGNSHRESTRRPSYLKSSHGPLSFTYLGTPNGREAQRVITRIYLFGQRPELLPDIEEEGLIYIRLKYKGQDHTISCSSLKQAVESADELLGLLNEHPA